jgi:hypothetical protein
MNYRTLALVIMAVAVIWHVATTMMIYGTLQKRGLKVSLILLRMMAPKYVSDYRQITRKETGKTGPLFNHWIISINTALAAAILLILAPAGGGR